MSAKYKTPRNGIEVSVANDHKEITSYELAIVDTLYENSIVTLLSSRELYDYFCRITLGIKGGMFRKVKSMVEDVARIEFPRDRWLFSLHPNCISRVSERIENEIYEQWKETR